MAQGLSQTALATKCQLVGWKISRDTLAKIETQIRWVADSEVVKLAKVLMISEQELLHPLDSATTAQSAKKS